MAISAHDEELLDALYADYAGPLLDYVQRLLGGDRFQAEDRFSEDPGPGQVTGDNFMDDFDGTSFTWHAVTAGGSTHSSSGASQPSNGY